MIEHGRIQQTRKLPIGLQWRIQLPTRQELEKVLEGVEILQRLMSDGLLENTEGTSEETFTCNSAGLLLLRLNIQWMLTQKRYQRAGRPETPRHTKQLVRELAQRWETKYGSWPGRVYDLTTGRETGPFFELVRMVFEPIRPDGRGLEDLVRNVLAEGPHPRATGSIPLSWPD